MNRGVADGRAAPSCSSDALPTYRRAESSFARDVIAGLTARPKRLPPKYFYDEAGAQLFEQITATPEYYPTRMRARASCTSAPARSRRFIPEGRRVDRVRQRLEQEGANPARGGASDRGLCAGRHFVEMLTQEAEELRRDHPQLRCCRSKRISRSRSPCRRRSQGCRASDFSRIDHRQFRAARGLLVPAPCRPDARAGADLLIGVDLVKDPGILNAAYNDAAGITAKFNLNLLARANRELDARFRPGKLQPPRLLQFRAPPHRDAPRQHEAPEGEVAGR